MSENQVRHISLLLQQCQTSVVDYEMVGHNLPNNPFLKKREQEWIYDLAALKRLFFKVGLAADFSTEAGMFFFPKW